LVKRTEGITFRYESTSYLIRDHAAY
jgi:hypothetical protein